MQEATDLNDTKGLGFRSYLAIILEMFRRTVLGGTPLHAPATTFGAAPPALLRGCGLVPGNPRKTRNP